MQIDKSQILDMLKSKGDDAKVGQAENQLPDKVDTERDAGLLATFGLDPKELIGKLGGGGLKGMLGG